jgi:hypothetical protein
MDQEASEDIPNPNQITIFDVIEEEEMAVCPPPVEEPEVESEFAAEDNIDEVVIYTDPAGNTFEAPVVDTPAPKAEPTIDASDLIGTYTLDEMPAVIDKIQEKIDQLENKPKEEPDFSLDFNSSDDEEDSDFTVDLF